MYKRFVLRTYSVLVGALALVILPAACGSSGAKAPVGTGSSRTTSNSSVGGSSSGGSSSSSTSSVAVTRPPDPCGQDGGCPPGVWVDVSPPSVNLVSGDCGNYGTKTVQGDANHPGDAYTLFFCQGVWKSSDYGQTWSGPINTGANGTTFGDCAGGITIPPNNKDSPPTIYASCIRGTGLGFWRSTNGGVDWTKYAGPDGSGQQFYPPTVDPYDAKHLLMTGHGVDMLAQSVDGGQTWTTVVTAAGMAMMGGTGELAFIDNGDPVATRKTWLWLSAGTGGKVGTWRTTDGGTTWKQVETNEHINGATQVYQPDQGGVIFMAGNYSTLGAGVLRSADYGQTWVHVGLQEPETVVFGTSHSLYAMYGWVQPDVVSLEVSPPPATGTWTAPGTPAAMTMGPAQALILNDGTANVILLANYNGGVWRYLEP
jgi:hypothetical protein